MELIFVNCVLNEFYMIREDLLATWDQTGHDYSISVLIKALSVTSIITFDSP